MIHDYEVMDLVYSALDIGLEIRKRFIDMGIKVVNRFIELSPKALL